MSNNNPEEDDFVELFEVRLYTGVLQDLRESIEELNGVNNVFLKTKKHQPLHTVEDESVLFDITYDPLQTDRTQICLSVEDFESVDGKVTNA